MRPADKQRGMRPLPEFFFAFNVLKFFLATAIVMLHVTSGRVAPNAYLGVDFFFMITGFLMWDHRAGYLSRSVVKSLAKRIGSFYFYYLFLIVFSIGLIVGQGVKIRPLDLMETALFLNFNLVNKIMPNSLWFLTVYMWVFVGYLGAMKILSRRVFLSIIGVVTLIVLAKLGTLIHIRDVHKIYLGVPIGFLRGIGGMGLGILVAAAVQYFNKNPLKQVADICLVAALGGVCYLFFWMPIGAVQIPFYALASITLFLLAFKQGYLCRALEIGGSKVPVLWGLFIPIYIYHMMIMTLLPARVSSEWPIVLGVTLVVSGVLFYVNQFVLKQGCLVADAILAKRVKKSK